ncbi:helix-turn-helix domain-containing protein [Aquimarina sp. 2201CG5-10]|uniref:helix-turn-helix domain-containing protein n=1 Tax=Aquimarina callyspongiae TaxID=3098150 RepID=UPI002AB41184|nr:helix-turn-helix domain-containing protein [Aquimarina sp. 2201CG5-10]MDY8136089.1 helix-turn-helix domain-containing protein [Aquimarina sp. 2201CG5-10]
MALIIVITIISSIGLGLSWFFGIQLVRRKEKHNVVLGYLLIVLSLRITKSVFYNFIELPVFIKNLGLAANLAIGPLLFLYGRLLLFPHKKVSRLNAVHFLPSLMYILFCTYISNDAQSSGWRWSYSFILFQSYFYIALSLYTYKKGKIDTDRNTKEWYLILISGLAAIWFMYFLIFVNVLPVYALGAISFSILIFVIAFLAIKREGVFKAQNPRKYANSKITFEQGMFYLEKLKKIIEEEKLYLDTQLTLKKLSIKLNISPRDISLIINRHTQQNFSNFINSYRIEKAKELLCSADKDTKIIAIALDSGFNSLSSFNVAFKALTNLTPTAYKTKYASHLSPG